MKYILYLMTFICFVFAFIFGGEYLYEQTYSGNYEIAEPNNEALNKAQLTQSTSQQNDVAKQSHIIKSTELNNQQKSAKAIIEKTPPHFLPGFDWRLPEKTSASKNSGLIAETNHGDGVIENRFIIVRWDESNPLQGQYDFSKLATHLKSIAPQKALIRLEVNSSCEAPKWALKQLRETKTKSLIYWDKNYQALTQPFIQTFAKRFAAHPQIIGVQLGLADGEFGEAPDSCNDYNNKNGWGEFWMSPEERNEAETNFGFTPDVFTQATIANIDIYANAFGQNKNKLAFTNIGTLFTYGEGAEPYNQNLKTIAKYVIENGLGNRDGAVERWMSYTDKVYGTEFTTMPDGSCLMGMNEDYIRQIDGRYWGTENEFYGNKDYVINEMGPVENHPYIFMISSLRALQMRRNAFSISDMRQIDHPDYKTQDFLKYLTLTFAKQYEDTPDAFVLMGERYIASYRLTDQMDVNCVRNNAQSVPVRSFGRWLTESPQNTQIENKPAIKVTMPASENYWYQGYYLPKGIDYEYFAREAKSFGFEVNDDLSKTRCENGCEVEVKATFKDTIKTKLHIEVAEGISQAIQTAGDNTIKTVTFTIKSTFANQMQGFFKGSDFSLHSENTAIPLILMRMNFLH